MKNASRIKRNARQLRLQAARAQLKNRVSEIVKNSFRPIFGFYPDNHIDELRERSFRLLETHGVAIEHAEQVPAGISG